MSFLQGHGREEGTEVFDKTMHTPLFAYTRQRRDVFPVMWFCQKTIVLYTGLAFSFWVKLSGPENVIPDVFSDVWILISPHPAILLHNSRCMSWLWEATPGTWNVEGRNKKDSVATSWWSVGVSIKEGRQSIYILKVLQLEGNSSGSAKKTSANILATKHAEQSSTIRVSVRFW